MLIETAIGNLLTTDARILALVDAANIYWPMAPTDLPNIFPCLVYRTVPPVLRDPILDPISGGYTGLVRTRFRVFASMKTRAGFTTARRIDAAVNKALLGFQGIVIDDTVSPVEQLEIQGIFAHQTSNQPEYDDRTQLASIFSDFDVWHEEQ